MNRLWVRLSLMISGVLLAVFFMQFLAITFDQRAPHPDDDGPGEASPAEIQARLVEFMLFSVLVGTASGLLIGKIISDPIDRLAQAARQLARGDHTVRVPPGGSHETRALATAFNHLVAELHHAEEARRNLMADVSHELRTPLTVLEGNLRAALDGVVPLDEAEVANLYGQTRHLIRLVNDLRELALAEAGQLRLEKTSTDLNALVADTLQALEPLCAEQGVALTNTLPNLPPLSLDPVRLRQVLFNLLGNALRHTPPGGRITVGGHTSAGWVYLAVSDTGEGLTAEQLATVFDRFYRADKSRSRETGGTGLGLAIVRAIVEAHSGRVVAHSAGLGRGCEFGVHLPML